MPSIEKFQDFSVYIKPKTSFPTVDLIQSASSSFEQEAQLHQEQFNTSTGVDLPQNVDLQLGSNILSPSCGVSQLREMLQHSRVPFEHLYCNTTCSSYSHVSAHCWQ